MNPVHVDALAAYDAGCSVMVATRNGTKRPKSLPVPVDCDHPRCVAKLEEARAKGTEPFGWKHYTHARLSRDEVDRQFRRAAGLCIITGGVSGNLLLLETDTADMADVVRRAAREAGWGDLIDLLDAGYLELSPSGGTHWLVRLGLADGESMPGSEKLAQRPKQPHEMADEHDCIQVLIETRAENAQAVSARSNGPTHPSGRPYVRVAGGFDTIPVLSWAEWTGLRAVAAQLDEMPARPEPVRRERSTSTVDTGDASPMNVFNREASWDDILEPHGWSVFEEHGDHRGWSRPGKSPKGLSATTIDDGPLYVFTSSTDFTPFTGYSKFAAYAMLNHRDDYSAAAKAIAAWGRQRAAS